MRITVPVVIEMTDEQVAAYAAHNGLPRDGGKLMTREVVEDVRHYVLNSVQQTSAFGFGGADVSIKER